MHSRTGTSVATPARPAKKSAKRANVKAAAPVAARVDQVDRLNRLLDAIYEGPMESPPWSSALQSIRGALQASHVTLMLRPPSSDSSGIMINTGNVNEQAIESYGTHFFSLDPFVRLSEGEVVTAEELIGKQWLDSPIYREYLKPLDIRHLLGADIYTKEGIECRFRVTRSYDSSPFTEDDKELCRTLLPHLKRSIRLHAKLDYLETDRQLFAGAVNRMLLGMITLSQDGNILDLNQEALRIINDKDGIARAGNALTLSSSQENRELQRLIKQALAPAGTEVQGAALVEAMSVTRPSGRSKLGIVIRAIPMGPFSENSKQRPAAAIFLRDPESSGTQPSHEVVRRLFGLTRMEASLALLLAEGLTLDEAAEQLNVMRNTARTHLRSIFCKTGVTRQTMLVRLLLNSVISLS